MSKFEEIFTSFGRENASLSFSLYKAKTISRRRSAKQNVGIVSITSRLFTVSVHEEGEEVIQGVLVRTFLVIYDEEKDFGIEE